MPVYNQGDAASFFATQGGELDDLMSAQVDPTQPQILGLHATTDPLVADQQVVARLANFDPTLYRLSGDSHLMHLMRALLGVAGVGGVRRQQTISRMAYGALSGTHFLDLDGFWGALFNTPRMTTELLPQVGGTQVDPSNTIAGVSTWDASASRDGRYRSRIDQLARGFAYGATYAGVRLAAEAMLGCECDLMESWITADQANMTTAQITTRTWFAVRSQYATYGAGEGQTWGSMRGGTRLVGDVPVGNRGEIVITPRRPITEEERLATLTVLTVLAPAGTIMSIQSADTESVLVVQASGYFADSNDWDVVSDADPSPDVTALNLDLYPSPDGEGARPAFGAYSGEAWSYNSRVSHLVTYTMTHDTEPPVLQSDVQTVVFNDGTTRDYLPANALLNPKLAALMRSGSEGVLSSMPYAEGRFG